MEITQEELRQKIKNGDKLIIDFWAKFCGPCKVMKPTFDRVSEELREGNSEVQLYTLDVENNRDIAVEYGVRAVPTIKVFNNGEVVDTKTGAQQEAQLIEIVDSLK